MKRFNKYIRAPPGEHKVMKSSKIVYVFLKGSKMMLCKVFPQVLLLDSEKQILCQTMNVYNKILEKIESCPDENEDLVDLEGQAVCNYYKAEAEFVMKDEKFFRLICRHCRGCKESCELAGYEIQGSTDSNAEPMSCHRARPAQNSRSCRKL